MDSNFSASYAFELTVEGGNDDDPDDSGGRTSRGITQREFTAYCGLHSLPSTDVWTMPDQTCETIYRVNYWQPYAPILPSGLDLMFFDQAVNQGMHEAIVTLQRAIGVKDDGHFGLVTMHAVKGVNDIHGLLEKLHDTRDAEYQLIVKRHSRDQKYIKGWLRRVNKVLVASQKLVGK